MEDDSQDVVKTVKLRSKASSMVERFHRLLRHEASMDFTFSCDGREFGAHKAVLFLYTDFFESKGERVEIKRVNPDILRSTIELMYMEHVVVNRATLGEIQGVCRVFSIEGAIVEVADDYGGLLNPMADASGAAAARKKVHVTQNVRGQNAKLVPVTVAPNPKNLVPVSFVPGLLKRTGPKVVHVTKPAGDLHLPWTPNSTQNMIPMKDMETGDDLPPISVPIVDRSKALKTYSEKDELPIFASKSQPVEEEVRPDLPDVETVRFVDDEIIGDDDEDEDEPKLQMIKEDEEIAEVEVDEKLMLKELLPQSEHKLDDILKQSIQDTLGDDFLDETKPRGSQMIAAQTREIMRIAKGSVSVRHLKSNPLISNMIAKVLYKCNHCDKTFKDRSALRHHTLCHLDVRMFACGKCGNKFKRNSHRKQHETLCDGHGNKVRTAESIDCGQCDAFFATEAHRRNHIRERHSENPTYACEQCGKAYFTRASLQSHEKSHEQDVNVICPTCGKLFKRAEGLERHMKLHSDDLLKCGLCDKGFVSETALKKHEIIHTGIKPYKCDFCDMAFYRIEGKRNHERTHTGERPYKCKYCDKAFRASGQMVVHERAVHTGKK